MKKYLQLPLYYIISSICLEIITFATLGLGILPKYVIFDLVAMLFLAGVVLLVRNNLAQLIVMSVFLILQFVLGYVNYTLLIQFGDILSVEMLALISAAANAMSNDFVNIWILMAGVLIIVIDIIGAIFVYLHVRRFAPSKNRHFSLILIGVVLFTQLSSVAIFIAQKEYIYSQSELTTDYVESDAFLLDSTLLKRKSIQYLGTFGFYINDISLSWLGNTREEANLIESALFSFRQTKNTLMAQSVTNHDDNIIMIMVESLDTFAISNELTPNLWSLINPTQDDSSALAYDETDPTTFATYDALKADGIDSNVVFNYYSKNKTNISEDISLLGSYPIMANMQSVAGSGYDTSLHAFDFSLPALLNNAGYITTYLHSYRGRFYNRNYVIKNIGFENAYFNDEAFDSENLKFGDWRREKDFVINNIDHIIPSTTEKFFTYYTTVGMHGNYDTDVNNLDQQDNVDKVANSIHYNYYVQERQGLGTEMYLRFKNYLASVVSFDDALGEIIQTLKDRGIYDNTALYVFGDHNAYYHNITYAIKDVAVTEYGDFGVNNVPLIIKSNATQKISDIKVFSSSNDNLPTVMDILGVDLYNPNLYLGDSLFNYANGVDSSRVNFSYTGGVASKDFFTLDLVDFDLQPDGNEENLELFKIQAKTMLRKIFMLNTLYKNSLYQQI